MTVDLLRQLEDFSSCLMPKLDTLRVRFADAALHQAVDFNIFRFIDPDENRLSDIIADLLDANGTHGQGHSFLNELLVALDIDLRQKLGGVNVRREDTTDGRRRVDITVGASKFGIGIENKPWAGDLPDQLKDYINHLRLHHGDHFCLLYLSGRGTPPAEESLSPTERQQLESQGQFRCWSYKREFQDWLKSCTHVCRADKVRFFLQDFVSFIDYKGFGGEGVLMSRFNEEETDLIVDHAFRSEANLDLVLKIGAAFPELRRRIIRKFLDAIKGKVEHELGRDWQVVNNDLSNVERIIVRKKAWGQELRVALVYRGVEPNEAGKVYYAVRPREFLDAERMQKIRCELDRKYRTGKSKKKKPEDERMSFWFQYAHRDYKDWTGAILLRMGQLEQGLIQHFAENLVGISRLLESYVEAPLSTTLPEG